MLENIMIHEMRIVKKKIAEEKLHIQGGI